MIRRVAMLSAHTSPLEQPGDGDAGGMNVYVLELSRRLAARGVEVDIFTRATSSSQPEVHDAFDGVRVHHVAAGPFEGLTKNDLPAQMCSFVRDVLRAEVENGPGTFDVVHSHYWLSGQVGTVAAERWSVPLVHTMHTMAKVKNARLAEGDTPEPIGRVRGEEEIVRLADRLVANTEEEAAELVGLYEADPAQVVVVHPGVDLDVFRADRRDTARASLGLADDAVVLLFAGRIQPLKAPDVLLRAVAVLLERDPSLRERLVVPVVGGASGSGLEAPDALADLARELGLDDVVWFEPPVRQDVLADWYAAASAVCVPSYNESFGLVALEAQACGTPVVAARVGGLPTAVADEVSGLLVDGHEPADWADALERLVADPGLADAMGRKAVEHASSFGWEATVDRTLEVYEAARAAQEGRR
ncbi:D-inositol-3-phosphate glycosyltransferase [Aeromicrobium sp. IC_218]|uniref:D-inositol-3-phosphate glycosyltransferase n=1 Tax=Aeromicrobium sp. IC_218 TaxID=2545468 RepID=UPI0010400013|nr:D-inositol-3-phosphate glycosyltransferase [Aeromicrobium sp. IC_218]TCI99091.1 D-inositol-3-phosphate glycosyltransferase [Aeromicrobium sp. IC_218]